MNEREYGNRAQGLFRQHEKLITRKNAKARSGNGVYDRYVNPVLTAEHTPLFWRYDFDRNSNPHLMERMGVNATFNAGAMEYEGKFLVFARVEGADRKSFLAVADSQNGGFEKVGAAAGCADQVSSAAECGTASGICGWKIRAVHAAAG